MSKKNPSNENHEEKKEFQQITEQKAQELTKLCTEHAQTFLESIIKYFEKEKEIYGLEWARESYLRMALLPGIYVSRELLTDEQIKALMPILEKNILEYVTIEDKTNEV